MRKKLLSIFAAYITLLLYHTHSFLTTTSFAGRDLVGAYSLVKVFGPEWTSKWFLGMPLFQFYPPGFFFAADLLGALTRDLTAFKFFTYVALIIFPLTAYYCFREIYDERTGLVAAILSISVVFLREPFSLIYQTLQVGLVAQMAAIPLLFLYIGVLWRDTRDSGYIVMILMALMILTHPYIAAIATLYTLIYLGLEGNLFKALSAFTGFLVTGWWWLPLLEKLWYFQSYTGPKGKLLNWPWIFLPLLFFERGRKTVSLFALGIGLLVLGTFDLGLNIQFYRFYVYGQIIVVMAAAPALAGFIERLEDRIDSRLALAVLSIVFLAPATVVDVSPDWSSSVETQGVVPEEGRMIVETSHSDLHNSYVPIQMMPLESNVTVVNGLYADSSISAPYLLGLEKSFAGNPVPNPVAVNANLSSEQLEKRFNYFGIEYALVRTDHAREKLSFMDEVAENRDFILLKHNLADRDRRAVKVRGSYKEWKELSRKIFRTDLRPVIYAPRDSEATPISMIDWNETGKDVKIEKQSIRPLNRTQALFGLRYR